MATDQLSEQEIQFRKRARRRLIGAVALVLLMVTVLPMVLDQREPTTPQPEIAISIPSQDGADFSSKIVPATEVPTEAVPVEAVPPVPTLATPEAKVAVAKEPVKVAPAPAKKNEPDNTAVIQDANDQPAPVEIASPMGDAGSPESKATNTPPAEAAKPAEKPKTVAAATSQTDKASPVATDKPQNSKASPKKGSFSVQLGVLLATANIKPLQSKVTAQGLRSYTEELNTPKGTMVRLRAGPFPTRAEAEQAYEKLKAAGLPGIIVTNK